MANLRKEKNDKEQVLSDLRGEISTLKAELSALRASLDEKDLSYHGRKVLYEQEWSVFGIEWIEYTWKIWQSKAKEYLSRNQSNQQEISAALACLEGSNQ